MKRRKRQPWPPPDAQDCMNCLSIRFEDHTAQIKVVALVQEWELFHGSLKVRMPSWQEAATMASAAIVVVHDMMAYQAGYENCSEVELAERYIEQYRRMDNTDA